MPHFEKVLSNFVAEGFAPPSSPSTLLLIPVQPHPTAPPPRCWGWWWLWWLGKGACLLTADGVGCITTWEILVTLLCQFFHHPDDFHTGAGGTSLFHDQVRQPFCLGALNYISFRGATETAKLSSVLTLTQVEKNTKVRLWSTFGSGWTSLPHSRFLSGKPMLSGNDWAWLIKIWVCLTLSE